MLMMKENAAVAGGCCSAGGMLPWWEGIAVAGLSWLLSWQGDAVAAGKAHSSVRRWSHWAEGIMHLSARKTAE